MVMMGPKQRSMCFSYINFNEKEMADQYLWNPTKLRTEVNPKKHCRLLVA